MTHALAVMVKNEEKTLPRLLASVADHVDSIVALDTGSTDGTLDILHEAGAWVSQAPFENFGKSRSLLMEAARNRADWVLLLDADQELHVDGPLPELTADCYLLKHNEVPEYWNTRLVRGDLEWHYEGATHEFLAGSDTMRRGRLAEWSVVHHNDGGSRADKFLRDKRLLLQEWAEDPTNARTAFYLANTFRDLGDIAGATHWYRVRVGMGGWGEEQYVAQLELGKLTRSKSDLVAAYVMRPTRREALYELMDLTPPSDDILFVTN